MDDSRLQPWDRAEVDEELDKRPPTPPPASIVKGIGFADEQNYRFRKTMEDAHVMKVGFMGKDSSTLLAIYDGHGGADVARFVSMKMPEYIEEEISSNPKMLLTDVLTRAHAICDEDAMSFEEEFALVGTTTSVALIDGMTLATANAGDARIVMCRADGSAERLTLDHKAIDESEVDRIKKNGGFVLHGRVNALLSVTRAIGDCALKQWVISEPHTRITQLNEDDRFLIIACDGLWDVVEDQDACKIVDECVGSGGSAEDCAKKLLNESLERGTTDNVSIIVALLSGSQHAPLVDDVPMEAAEKPEEEDRDPSAPEEGVSEVEMAPAGVEDVAEAEATADEPPARANVGEDDHKAMEE